MAEPTGWEALILARANGDGRVQQKAKADAMRAVVAEMWIGNDQAEVETMNMVADLLRKEQGLPTPLVPVANAYTRVIENLAGRIGVRA